MGILDEFVTENSGLSERSLITYRKALSEFEAWCRNEKIESILTADYKNLLQYRSSLVNPKREPPLSSATAATYISAVKSFYKWIEKTGRGPNPALQIERTKIDRGFKKDALTKEQVEQLLDGILTSEKKESELIDLNSTLSSEEKAALKKEAGTKTLRNYAIVNLIIRTGLRTVEVSRANIGDIRKKGNEILLYVQGKGKKEKKEFVILKPGAFEPISLYLNLRKFTKPELPLFTSLSNRNSEERLSQDYISRIFKKALRYIGIDDSRLTAHSGRHTAAHLYLEAGGSIVKLQEMLRHASVDTTRFYTAGMERLITPAEEVLEDYLEDI